MADSFSGAEGSVDAQKKSALDALAQFGRRGLEAAVIAQQEGNRVQSETAGDNATFANQLGADSRAQAELAALGAPARDAYARNGAQAVAFLESENAAEQAVNSNFYGQLRQAVPLARTEAAQMVDEYRAAHAERQAQIAADAEARRMAMANAALEQQMLREQMAREQQLHDLQYAPYFAAIGEAMRQQANAATWRDRYATSGWGR
jgi:hypothetical protein